MSAALRLIIFDVDGTLVDSQNHILAAMRAAFAAEAIDPPTRQQILGIVGRSLPLAFADLLPRAESAQIERLTGAFRNAYNGFNAAGDVASMAPLYPGAVDLVTALASQPETLLGIATGNSRRGLDAILNVHGLDPHFITTQVADSHPSKPHPSMVNSAMDEVGVTPDQTVMIGDTSFDMEMGRAAGVASLGVTWGYHDRARLVAAGAQAIFTDFAELAGFLNGFGTTK